MSLLNINEPVVCFTPTAVTRDRKSKKMNGKVRDKNFLNLMSPDLDFVLNIDEKMFNTLEFVPEDKIVFKRTTSQTKTANRKKLAFD